MTDIADTRTPTQRIDDNLDFVLRAAGSSALRHYMPSTQERMREAMRKIMSQSYIDGSNDAHKAMRGQ